MPDDALRRLLQGNARFVADKSLSDESTQRRIAVAAAQAPFATVFGCVDSRVSPELIFDQGIGDLFVIRTAGQVLDRAVLVLFKLTFPLAQVTLLLVGEALLLSCLVGLVGAAIPAVLVWRLKIVDGLRWD